MRLLNFSALTLLVLANSCVTVPNIRGCTVAGFLEAGANCSTSNTGVRSTLTVAELIYMLEPQLEKTDPVTGVVTPKRAGAVIISAEDYKRAKDAQELACRLLGRKCDYEGMPK